MSESMKLFEVIELKKIEDLKLFKLFTKYIIFDEFFYARNAYYKFVKKSIIRSRCSRCDFRLILITVMENVIINIAHR